MAVPARLHPARHAVLILGFLVLLSGLPGLAQDRSGRRPPPPDRGQGQRKPHAPLLSVLDIDRDGQLSAEEIAAAPTRLRLVDPDADGTLTETEVSELRPSHEIQEAYDPVAFIRRCFRHDRNRDGQLTRGELPTHMKRLVDRADANRDEAISERELETYMKAFVARFPKPRRPRN